MTNGLYRIHPNGTGLEAVITKGIGSNGLRGLAVDWVHDQIYFTNSFPHETFLEISKLDGKFRKVLNKKGSDSPRELAVNPIKKFLYWIDFGQFPRIGRAYLDGSGWKELVVSGLGVPKDITIDYGNHDVYWVDAGLDNVQKVNYLGANRLVIQKSIPNPVGISVFRSQIYYADKNLGSVFRTGVDSTKNSRPDLIRPGLKNLRAVKYYDAYAQPESENYCSICEQLCYAIESRYVCDCATGKLVNNKCVGLEEYVVFSTRTELRSVHVDVDNGVVPWAPVGNLTNVVGVDFDWRDGRILFSQIRPESKVGWVGVGELGKVVNGEIS